MQLKHPLILASSSPRRQELMANAGFKFQIRVIPIDEVIPANISARESALYLAEMKSEAHKNVDPDEILLTADTVVIKDDKILGKPETREEAISMIRQLSGASHEVITGVCIRKGGTKNSFSISTTVEFAQLTSEEIEHYVDNYQPYDKAGAYGIQEWIGQIGVKSIIGSYYNVVGLPIHEIYQALKIYGL